MPQKILKTIKEEILKELKETSQWIEGKNGLIYYVSEDFFSQALTKIAREAKRTELKELLEYCKEEQSEVCEAIKYHLEK